MKSEDVLELIGMLQSDLELAVAFYLERKPWWKFADQRDWWREIVLTSNELQSWRRILNSNIVEKP